MPIGAFHPVLLVDDSTAFLKALEVVFQQAGFRTVSARTGVEALVRAMEEPFCAVVTDCEMPIMTGFQLCRLLKDETETRVLPVVLMTGSQQRMGRVWARTCGADRFWIKRDNLEHLVGLVEELAIPIVGEVPDHVEQPSITLDDIQRRLSSILERRVLELSLRHTVSTLGNRAERAEQAAWGFLDVAYDLVAPGAIYCILPTPEGHRAYGVHSRGLDPQALVAQVAPIPWARDLRWQWRDYPVSDALPPELILTSRELNLAGGQARGAWGFLAEPRYPESCARLLEIAHEEFTKVLQGAVALELLKGAVAQLERADQVKTDYVQTLCHEIRNPLTAAMGHLDLALVDETMSPKTARALIHAGEAMDRQRRLLDVVLDLEKLEAGGTPLASAPVDLEALGRQCFLLLEGIAAGRGVRFRLVAQGPGSWGITSDGDRLAQCLTNLLGNALKFSPKDGTITLQLRRGLGVCRMEVRDEGPGLPPGFEAKVFSKFEQGGDRPGGTGLGLSITRRLAEAMGGRVGVDKPEGVGACFWIEIPTGD